MENENVRIFDDLCGEERQEWSKRLSIRLSIHADRMWKTLDIPSPGIIETDQRKNGCRLKLR